MTSQEYRLRAFNCFARYDATGNPIWQNLGKNWLKLADDSEKIKTQAIMLGCDLKGKMAA